MNVKKIAAVFAAAAIIGSASYSLTDHFILEDVVVVSAATTLRRNSTGSEVTKLQNNLIKLNYLSKGSATGKYNAATEAAVKQFQTDYSLYVDGIAGSKTLSLLSSIVSGSVKTVEVRSTVLNVRYTASPAGKLLTTGEAYRLSFRELKLRGVYLTNMLRLGVPAGLQSSMYAVSNMIIQVAVNSLGTVVVASWAMTSKTDGLFWAVSSALGAAITSFVGQNYGAGRVDRVRLCVRQGALLSGVITVTLSALIMLLGKPLLRVLTEDGAVIDTTYRIMTYFVPYYFTWVAIEVLSAVLRGAGDAVRPVVIIGLGICLLRIIWIGTLFTAVHTLFVLCLCYPVSWVVTGLALYLYFRRGAWKDRGGVIVDH